MEFLSIVLEYELCLSPGFTEIRPQTGVSLTGVFHWPVDHCIQNSSHFFSIVNRLEISSLPSQTKWSESFFWKKKNEKELIYGDICPFVMVLPAPSDLCPVKSHILHSCLTIPPIARLLLQLLAYPRSRSRGFIWDRRMPWVEIPLHELRCDFYPYATFPRISTKR
jgi:hypothetical protein